MAGMKQQTSDRLAAGLGNKNELTKGNDHVSAEDPRR